MSSFLLGREETSSRVIVPRIIGRVQLGSKWFAFRFLPLLPFWRWVCRGINRRLPKFTLLLPLNTFVPPACLYCVKTGMNNYRDSQFLRSPFFAKKTALRILKLWTLNKDRKEEKRFPSFLLESSRVFSKLLELFQARFARSFLGEPLVKRVGIQLGRSLDPQVAGIKRFWKRFDNVTNVGKLVKGSPSICDWKRCQTISTSWNSGILLIRTSLVLLSTLPPSWFATS